MSELLKADIFFFVATIATLVLLVLAIVAFIYIIKILRNIEDISETAKKQTHSLSNGIDTIKSLFSFGKKKHKK